MGLQEKLRRLVKFGKVGGWGISQSCGGGALAEPQKEVSRRAAESAEVVFLFLEQNFLSDATSTRMGTPLVGLLYAF